MIEVWRDIEGYENSYQISNYGRIKRKDRINALNKKVIGRIRKQTTDKHGYLTIYLHQHNQSKFFLVHRLVANAFLLNFENKPQVNHIDGNKLNNKTTNLEWVTGSENTKHAWENRLTKGRRKNKEELVK